MRPCPDASVRAVPHLPLCMASDQSILDAWAPAGLEGCERSNQLSVLDPATGEQALVEVVLVRDHLGHQVREV